MEINICTITDVYDVYYLICELENTQFDFENFKKVFNSKIEDQKNYCILAKNDSNTIGFLNLNIDYKLHHKNKVATIEELIVSYKFRNNGIGKLLINNAIKYAKNNNCELIELTSNFSREKAHNFYIKNGFKKTSYKFKMDL